ncbi:restriction endonuclease [Bacillus wiedmannii]|uniref:restriction endonuclease n=1 Tax=Bacillus wiedmannii TaxID=1890302 RepID=UPI0039FC1830
MWGFFKRKKQDKLPNEDKFTRFARKKEEMLQEARKLISNFYFDFEYVSENLQHALCIDRQSRKIAFVQLANTNKEPEILALNNLDALGIRYDSREIGIERFSYFSLEDQYKPEECAKSIEPTTMSTMYVISLYFRHTVEYVDKKEIVIPFYNKETSEFSYLEKHEELKNIYQFLVNCLIEDEKATRQEARITELKSIIDGLEEKRERALKKQNRLKDNRLTLTRLLFELKEYIPFSLHQDIGYYVDTHKIDLCIKGFRNEILYIGCNYEAFEPTENPEIIILVSRIIELNIQDYGYNEVCVIPCQSDIEELSIATDTSIQQQIVREVLHHMDLRMEIFSRTCEFRTFYNNTLFINYDSEDILYYLKTNDIKWDKEKLPSLEFLIGNESVNIAFVPSDHKIEYISLENLGELWNIVIQYALKMEYYSEDMQEALLLSKAHSYENGALSIYNVKIPNSLPYDLIDRIQYAFFIHTGSLMTKLEMIENPEGIACQDEDSGGMPQAVVDWISELKSQPHTLFEVFDFRHINEEFYVFMDNKLYVASRKNFTSDKEYRLPEEPWMANLTKRSLRIKGGYMSLGEYHYTSCHEEFVSNIRTYLTTLDQMQLKQMEPWEQALLITPAIQTLFERFYKKKVKPDMYATYLDDILDQTLNIDEEIETFIQFLIKRKYLEGDEFLVGVFVREQVVKLAIHDFSVNFLQHNGVHFENVGDMTLTGCLQKFHTLDFAMVENREDVANFMCFLIKNDKLTVNGTYQDLYENLYNMLIQEGEEQTLQDYESYLLAEDENIQSVTLERIDQMDGYQFEEFVAQLFQDMGYKTEVTSSSGDYGIDVIARRKGLSIGIQAKRYSDKVPNKAVQEVIAGIAYYNLDQGMVITNNFYTKQAQNQAKGTNVLLWDRDMLQRKLYGLYGKIDDLHKNE